MVDMDTTQPVVPEPEPAIDAATSADLAALEAADPADAAAIAERLAANLSAELDEPGAEH